MLIEIPEDTPTTMAQSLTKMAQTAPVVRVGLETGQSLDLYLTEALERDDHGVNVLGHPWVYSGDHGVRVGSPNYDLTHVIPAELIHSITVY